MDIPFLQLNESNRPFRQEMTEAACRVIESGWYLNGPEKDRFERELAEFCHSTSAAVAVSNGLDALRLIFRALIETGRLRCGDEVIVPANTYIASILPVIEMGLKPVAVEPSEKDFNLDPVRIEEALTERTRAVLVVHLYGYPCWDAAIMQRLRDRGLLILEDNAQAIGAIASSEGFNGTAMTGNLGDAAAFSFYPTKNLGALGDAGAVITPHADIRDCVAALANYGSDRRYHNIYRGYNCRMDELQASFLRIKLRHLDAETAARNAIARIYDAAIKNPEVKRPTFFTDRTVVWHQYPIHTARRDELRKYLASRGIGTDIHYAAPPHLQPCMKGVFSEHLPITERLALQEISLPIANISPIQAETIATIINEFK